MESLGKKLQQARLARKISLEEASRVTKIRPARIQEIEADDFSSFSSLAYAKGFILIYGKFLDVDVTPYLDAFETSREVSVDGYSYLQDAPAAPPPPIVRRQAPKRPALLPFIIAVGVLVIGLYFVRLLLNIQRITPTGSTGSVASASATATFAPTITPTPSPAEDIVAPRAVPVGTPLVAKPAEALASATPAATPVTSPSPTEPEVRRAEPVNPGDVAAETAARPPLADLLKITPMRKTFVRVTLDSQSAPAFNGWLDPSDAPLTFRGRRFVVKVLERGAVEISKNGTPLAAGDSEVSFE